MHSYDSPFTALPQRLIGLRFICLTWIGGEAYDTLAGASGWGAVIDLLHDPSAEFSSRDLIKGVHHDELSRQLAENTVSAAIAALAWPKAICQRSPRI